jgi:hypothetical protein
MKLAKVLSRRGVREEGINVGEEPNWGTIYAYMELSK